MKSTRRTLLSIALFVPLALVILMTFACLPVPVGNPETSKIDDTLSGFYQQVPKNADEKDLAIALLKPWDSRTYMLDYRVVGKDGDTLFKAWLTPMADKTFITAEPIDTLKDVLDKEKKPTERVWVVFRVDKVAGGLELRMVNLGSDFLKNLKTQAEYEAAIKAHVSDNDLYVDPITFKKVDK
jgi:hypothetical protein